ncbi:hypothetical protein FACS18945_6270 [Bacteroidia bacterium]|nr:hypothetical protein FACS18945_6270 [Bacteroidia bacterium]
MVISGSFTDFTNEIPSSFITGGGGGVFTDVKLIGLIYVDLLVVFGVCPVM